MTLATVHDPDLYMADLRLILSHGTKRIGLLLGAGAPTAVHVDDNNRVVTQGGQPLIPDVAGLTTSVLANLSGPDEQVLAALQEDLGSSANIEALLTRARQLAAVLGNETVHHLDGIAYDELAKRLGAAIGKVVAVPLPSQSNPYSELVAWIAGTQRQHAVEVFTPNYDLLLEEAFERARVTYFDGFVGSHRPFFDPASVLWDKLPARWSRLWKLHGSLGWATCHGAVVRTGNRADTTLIYPDHLKYDEVTRLPYSAFFDRLRNFLTTPDTLLICSGFSFRDAHICSVLDESLALNPHTAVLAFQFGPLSNHDPAIAIAESRPNISIYAADAATINGIPGRWQPTTSTEGEWRDIRSTFWGAPSLSEPERFLLGDFSHLARFLGLIQARWVTTFDADTDAGSSRLTSSPTADAESADA